MSEVGDKMVSCTISDLDAKLDNAHEANDNENLFEKVHAILSKMPSGNSNNDEQVDNLGKCAHAQETGTDAETHSQPRSKRMPTTSTPKK